MDDLICSLALKKIPGFSDSEVSTLLKNFKNPCDIFGISRSGLLKSGIKNRLIEILLNDRIKKRAFFDAITEIEEASKNGVKIITADSPLYPSSLSFIRSKPLILYYKGVLKENFKFAVAIAGQRTPPPYSVELAENLTEKFCSAGFSIVSGLASGIDTAAHRSALKNKGYTIAFIGEGLLAPIYPPENIDLFQEIILNNGAVISEFPLHMNVSAKNLVLRDRLQTGSSLGVLAMSSGLRGGTMKTCNFALKQKRPVFIPAYKDELMDKAENAGLKSLLYEKGVYRIDLKKDLSFSIPEIIDVLRIVYNELYEDEDKDNKGDSLLSQPELFG